MANRRMVTSDLYEDDFYMGLDLFQQNLWIGLIVRCADDQGRIQDNPILIKSQIYPAADYPAETVNDAINTFASAGKVMRYEVGGKKMIQIINWWKHQTPSWAAASKYPAPNGWTDRVKVHGKGTQVTTLNWDNPGGFELPKPLPNGLGNTLPNTLNEGDVKGDVKGEDEGEGSNRQSASLSPVNPFDAIQQTLESKGIMASGPVDCKTISELIKEGVTPADVLEGINWKAANNGGKAIKYLSAIVGPAKTAMQKRLQVSTLPPPKTRTLTDAHGNTIQVPA